MTELVFLGTSGGRFATFLQARATGGLYVRDGVNVHIDPGPGAAWQMRRFRLDPTRTDAILVSHCHPDHYADAETLIEGMTRGGLEKRGTLVGSATVIDHVDGMGPAVSKFHQGRPERVLAVKAGDAFDIGGLKIRATPSHHTDPTTVGFYMETHDGGVGYVSDTHLADDIVEARKGAKILVISMTRPRGARIPNHLCTEDAAKLIAGVQPRAAILTHFGMKVINQDPIEEAKWIQAETGIRTVVARDGMRFHVERMRESR